MKINRTIILTFMFLVVIIGIILYFLLIQDITYFKRMAIPSNRLYEKQILKHYRINHYRMNNHHYFEKGNRTFKGGLFVLKQTKENIRLQPRSKGDFIFFVEAVIHPESQLRINMYQNRTKIWGQTFHQKRVFPSSSYLFCI